MPDIDRITAGRRHRRLRRHDWVRAMVRESALVPSDFIAPLFVIDGEDREEAVASMPRVVRHSVDRAVAVAKRLHALGVPAIALFPAIARGCPEPGGIRLSLRFDAKFKRTVHLDGKAAHDRQVQEGPTHEDR